MLKQVVVASISGIFIIVAVKVMIQWYLLSDQSKSIILRKLSEPAKTQSNTGGTASIEKTGEVYDYSENTDGSFEYYSYMNRDFNVTATANTYAKGDSNYELQYKDKNVNGVDTTTTYKYIKNVDCTSKKTNSVSAITLDHSNGRKLTLPG